LEVVAMQWLLQQRDSAALETAWWCSGFGNGFNKRGSEFGNSMTVQQLCQQRDNAVPTATAWQYSRFGNSVTVQPLWQQLPCSVKWKPHLDRWQQLLPPHSEWRQ